MIRRIVEDNSRLTDHNKNKVRILDNIRLKKKNASLIVYADRGRLTQVLSNLLSNAIKFTLEKKEKRQVVSVSASMNNGDVIVSVKDSGEGIHPDIFSRLFTKFTTKSFTGTGLGLFISEHR